MKNVLFVLAVAILMVSCDSKVKKENALLKAEIEALAVENEMLVAEEIMEEITIEQYQLLLLEVDASLDAIDEKNIALNGQIEGGSIESDIKLHLAHIHGTMSNSKHKIAKMQKNINQLHADETLDEEEILLLEASLDDAAEKIMVRDEVINVLQVAVVEEGIMIDELAVAYEEQLILSVALYSVLNTAYVIAGTTDELEEAGIISSEGGFLGLGKVKQIDPEANDGLFIPTPIDATVEIDLNCKEAKILTNHSEASYSFVGDGYVEKLVINDPLAFWDKSDFLILEIVKE